MIIVLFFSTNADEVAIEVNDKYVNHISKKYMFFDESMWVGPFLPRKIIKSKDQVNINISHKEFAQLQLVNQPRSNDFSIHFLEEVRQIRFNFEGISIFFII